MDKEGWLQIWMITAEIRLWIIGFAVLYLLFR